MTDDEIMQAAHDSIGCNWPLRQPKDPNKLEAFHRARELLNEARSALESCYNRSRPGHDLAEVYKELGRQLEEDT